MLLARTIDSVPASGAADPAAFAEIVERYQQVVCAVAYSTTGDRALSEEIAQETFLVAWRKLPELDTPPALPGWLCGIARNLGRNARRRRHEEPNSPATDLVAADRPSAADELAEEESRVLVWRALEELPAEAREPLVLYYRADHSLAEVAAALDISEDAARQRLSRARRALKASVADLVERSLRAGKPGAAFGVAVMAAIGREAAAAPVGAPAGAAIAGAGFSLVTWLIIGALAVGGSAAAVIGVVAAQKNEPQREERAQRTQREGVGPETGRTWPRPVRSSASSSPSSASSAVQKGRASGGAASQNGLPLDERAQAQRKIDLDFGEADTANVLELISHVMEIPIVVRGRIEPRVSLRLRDVPALDALDEVLRQTGAARTEIPVLRLTAGPPPAVAAELTGTPVTADFRDADLHEVAEVLSRHLDVPILVPADLPAPRVTARFTATPAAEAFAVVLRLTHLGFETDFGYQVTVDDEEE